MPSTAPLFFHQAGGFQRLQMLRHRGPRDRKPRRQISYRKRRLAQERNNRLPRRVGKGAEQFQSVSHTLR